MATEDARERVLASVVTVVGQVGIARLTVDEVAAEAGVSRASVYRWFPGGREQLVDEGVTYEVGRFLGRLGTEVEGLPDLRARLVRGLVFARRAIEDHEVLQHLLETEPGGVLPQLQQTAPRRTFRGGKAEVLQAVLSREIARFRTTVEAALAGAEGLEDKVIAGVVSAAGFLESHDALRFLVLHEPDVILPWVAFHRIGALYAVVAGFAAPHLARELGDGEHAARAAEWLARVVLTYVAHPVPGLDLADPVAARHLLSTYVLPGLVPGTAATKEFPRVR